MRVVGFSSCDFVAHLVSHSGSELTVRDSYTSSRGVRYWPYVILFQRINFLSGLPDKFPSPKMAIYSVVLEAER